MEELTRARVAPGASVAPGARLHEGVEVAPGVVIEDDVEVGPGTRLLAGTVLHAGTRVGAGCRLGPYAVVGGEPMDARYRGELTLTVLEDGVVLREFATVHRATGEGEETRVGAGTLVMSYAHVSHNCRVGARCTLTTAVQLGGHVEVGDHAVIGSGSMMHQFGRVGAYAMFGAASAANQDLLPFAMARGNPARHYRLNRVGLERAGISGERYRAIERALRHVRRRELEALAQLAAESPDARLLHDFVLQSKRGVARFATGG
ncbi:MAG: acyl-ACP--UDP-N-acetylglucosamine O-acyltransferase [Deinococcales bacterium]|nr:acyl-ACP--UDP-N-acetylglucosamine O-acyltransferase [Deinococcales bacterium]